MTNFTTIAALALAATCGLAGPASADRDSRFIDRDATSARDRFVQRQSSGFDRYDSAQLRDVEVREQRRAEDRRELLRRDDFLRSDRHAASTARERYLAQRDNRFVPQPSVHIVPVRQYRPEVIHQPTVTYRPAVVYPLTRTYQHVERRPSLRLDYSSGHRYNRSYQQSYHYGSGHHYTRPTYYHRSRFNGPSYYRYERGHYRPYSKPVIRSSYRDSRPNIGFSIRF